MSFCIKCGSKLEEKDLFCTNCGEKIKKEMNIEKTINEQGSQIFGEDIRKHSKFKIVTTICVLIIICFGAGYSQKDYFYFEYYTYKANKASYPIDKLFFSDKALNYKINETSLNNYENAIKQNINNLNVVTTSLQNNKEKISKDIYNSMMIGAYKIQLKKFVTNNNNEDAFKTFIKLSKYGYNYRKNENYNNVMLNLCNLVTNSNIKNVGDLNKNGIAFGDIDNDGIDEIIQISHLFYDFNCDYDHDLNSYVSAYKFNGQNFTKIDTIKTDLVNKGSKIFIGKPNKEITAVILDGYIGVHSGETNAYFINNGKLEQLMSKNIHSIYPVDPKDIDNDGFIEFGSMDVDPNSIDKSMAGSDKIVTWFKADANGNTTDVKKVYIKNQDFINSTY
jgi:hypothetical protein